MIKPYDVFIEETRKENPDMFEALGEDYFRKFYETQVKVEADYRRIKEAFTTTQPYGKLIDLQDVDIADTKTLVDRAKVLGENLAIMLSDNVYDALYVCPEIAAFIQLSPFFKRADTFEPVGVYKFGSFGTDNCCTIDCYKAPNEVAVKDRLLLHTVTGEWKKFEVNISEFYKRKYDAEREKASSLNMQPEFQSKCIGEVCITDTNISIRKAMKEVLDFMEKRSGECDKKDINAIIAWDRLWNDFYEDFYMSERYNDYPRKPIYEEAK